MTDLPLNGQVHCTDGDCGRVTNVILNPVSQVVTHIALVDDSLPDNATRLVPADRIESSSAEEIRLNCTRSDVAGMQPFVVSRLIQQSPAGSPYASSYASQYVFNDTSYENVEEQEIPEGALAVVSGMSVSASDGPIGKLDELVLDANTGRITHLQMREGHLWGKKDVVIPIAEFGYLDGDTIHLKLDKKTVKALPAIKVKRPS